jgi:hypothetical protein
MRKLMPRGSALLAAMIVIGVLALVTAVTLTMASISKGNSARDARSLSQMSCVEAGRQYIFSRLRLFGLDPTSITLDQAVQVETGTRHLYTGHVRPVVGGQPQGTYAVVTAVLAVPGSFVGGGGSGSENMSNRIGRAGGTGTGGAYRVVVACTDPLAGDMELEFTFKYGL